ncbi:ABC transporter ATP-binding protein [Telmatospirillum siberiense]|uniref:Branched-chain amino acid ABC transporter ATP-binding protein n=1 Tax=Telmatospirillum siberiense TaxID=382514 RepID=A0A2N3PT57_9PROT|nr:ABC transporter ATP-binding protein [Telmatospirillum siberiense]PKU23590.1 branched-chain amino acid ABC transporter ATP-binding protein [Telmatospirillum siberiense]
MLEVSNIRVSYRRVPALQGVSFSLKEGEVVSIVGGNGNGKSTTLRAIAGLNPLDEGTITFKGRDLAGMPAHERVRQGLVLVPEGRRLFPRLSVEQNLRLGAFTRDKQADIRDGLDFAYQTFPVLSERRRQQAGTLSGGEQQMLAICRGLMSKPELLMLDEPSWGVAPKLVTRILETIRDIAKRGITILLVEQNVHRALEIADRAYVIQTGRIVMEGSGKELLANDQIRQAYLGI